MVSVNETNGRTHRGTLKEHSWNRGSYQLCSVQSIFSFLRSLSIQQSKDQSVGAESAR